ncbi:MAG: GSCFA domain-containing protein [Prolixibacteraceae bacterium]|jgi:hypothetical protein|nr:GSCFA domain-containing protein [Prolixibacteraceae bacterium]
MKFFTEVEIPPCPWKIDYQSGVMLMGSCFTENIGQRLANLKFNVDVNPFGILYNPVSLANSLKLLMQPRQFEADDLFSDRGVWNSFLHHSRFSGTGKEQVLHTINHQLQQSSLFLREARFLILTFGTAWVYESIHSKQVVSNCHKLPACEFHRYRLTVDEIVATYRTLTDDLQKFNPNIKIVFTVSPIRHWKDGAIENQRSKATLLLAVDQIVKEYGAALCYYFPSYEILMDELRDYRFYASDMLHLSDTAVEYIYSRFCRTMVSDDSLKLAEEVLKIRKAAMHRAFNPASEEYRKFLLYNLRQIDRLTEIFPFLNFKIEKTYFQGEMTRFLSE